MLATSLNGRSSYQWSTTTSRIPSGNADTHRRTKRSAAVEASGSTGISGATDGSTSVSGRRLRLRQCSRRTLAAMANSQGRKRASRRKSRRARCTWSRVSWVRSPASWAVVVRVK